MWKLTDEIIKKYVLKYTEGYNNVTFVYYNNDDKLSIICSNSDSLCISLPIKLNKFQIQKLYDLLISIKNNKYCFNIPGINSIVKILNIELPVDDELINFLQSILFRN